MTKGGSLRGFAAEMDGKVAGTPEGKGGLIYMADQHRGLMATTGVVGAPMPLAADAMRWIEPTDGSLEAPKRGAWR